MYLVSHRSARASSISELDSKFAARLSGASYDSDGPPLIVEPVDPPLDFESCHSHPSFDEDIDIPMTF